MRVEYASFMAASILEAKSLSVSKHDSLDCSMPSKGFCLVSIMNDCQEKALRECCHEREGDQIGMPSTEKTNTKEDLARVTTKSRS